MLVIDILPGVYIQDCKFDVELGENMYTQHSRSIILKSINDGENMPHLKMACLGFWNHNSTVPYFVEKS